GWMANWCDRCVHDRPARQEEGPGCPLVLVALMGRTPAQWLTPDADADAHVFAEYHCIEFRGEDDGPGPEPQPVPDPPGQFCLWPREPFESVRMFVQPCPEAVPAGAGVER
ncbi:hypothetical protein ACFV06_38750, partial [Streptomyces sp. NPDC059618]|uniref:hypothetical protein n=1 Tax=Streptomyces sp. NPDC059618 TaxID=3346887 RepID=UPI0036AD783F